MKENITIQELEQIKKEGVVIVDFYTTWCGDCAMMKPVFDSLATEYEPKGAKFLTVDAEASNVFHNASDYSILKVPTFIVFKDGKEVARGTEYQPKELMKQWLDDAL